MSAESVVLELAGLLKSGMPANLAREELGIDLDQLSELQAAQFNSVWSLAMSSGGAVSGAIQALGETFRETGRHKREIQLAFAGPKATARLVSWLPAAGIIGGQLMGMRPINAIFTNPIAGLSVAIGLAFLAVGRIWTKSILSKAAPSENDPGLFFDSVRFGVTAGLPLSKAIETASSASQLHLSTPPDAAVLARLARMAEINRSSGASISDLLAAEALVRREQQRFAESTALAKLSVRLMIPLGVLTLPAFVLSTIVPVAISLLSNRQI
jgi:tight adherence protein B